jgi:integrase
MCRTTVLVLEANIFMRISDILQMRLSSIIRDGDRYRLDIIEKKTKKKRQFTIPAEIYTFIQEYAINRGLKKEDLLFDITARQVQKHIQLVVNYLGIEGAISTHSFRKMGATEVYKHEKDIFIIKELLQHSSIQTSEKYINIRREAVERAIANHIKLPK